MVVYAIIYCNQIARLPIASVFAEAIFELLFLFYYYYFITLHLKINVYFFNDKISC